MLRHRLLGTAVVLFALTLLHSPPFARSEIIFEDDSSLTALDNSTATYNATTRDLHITGNDAFNVILAASEPVLSLDLKLVEESRIRIVSASVARATCRWEITTKKLLEDAVCTMTFAVNGKPLIFSTDDDNCRSKDFALLKVDMLSNSPNITVEDMDLSTNQKTENEVLERLKKCTELQPKSYPNQPIQNISQQFSGVTYVWKIAITKTFGKDFYIHLPESMTPVRLEPDPLTTTALTSSTTTPPTATGQTSSPSSNTAESKTVMIVCASVGALLLVIAIIAVVLCVVCKYRRKKKAEKESLINPPAPERIPTYINPGPRGAKTPKPPKPDGFLATGPNAPFHYEAKDFHFRGPAKFDTRPVGVEDLPEPTSTETAITLESKSEHVGFDKDLNEVYEIGSEVEVYIDRPNPKKARKKRAAKPKNLQTIIEREPMSVTLREPKSTTFHRRVTERDTKYTDAESARAAQNRGQTQKDQITLAKAEKALNDKA